jgi:hypothetical protein
VGNDGAGRSPVLIVDASSQFSEHVVLRITKKQIGIRSSCRWLVFGVLLSTALACGSIWEGPPRRLDFAPYGEATSMIACSRVCLSEKIATIEAREKIRDAAQVLQRYPDGWRESWNAAEKES